MQYSVFETAERDKGEYYMKKLKIKEDIKKISQCNGGRKMVIKQDNRRDG